MDYNHNYEKCAYFREKVRLIIVPEISVAKVQGVKSKNSNGTACTSSNDLSTFYYEVTKHLQLQCSCLLHKLLKKRIVKIDKR